MHTDEAVHAVKLGILLETGTYEYNPHEYHGPLIYYAALPFVWATGATSLAEIPDEVPLRLPIVIFSALLVAAVVLCGGALGRPEAAFAALLFSVSPAFSFYGKYYIQEVPFVVFCFVSLAAAWQILQTHKWRWAVLAGFAMGCAIALKETWVMIAGPATLTAFLLHLTTSSGRPPTPLPWKKYGGMFALAGAVALFTGLALLSNFFKNPAAIGHTFAALGEYVNRGVSGDSSTFGANIHDHPWYYYMQLLVWPPAPGPWTWTEGGTMFLGVIGFIVAIRRWTTEPRAWHFVAIFTFLLTAFYSAIPYKTPWNVLPMFAGWTLLAGRGATAIVAWVCLITSRSESNETTSNFTAFVRVFLWLLLLAWPACLAVQTWRATIARPADIRNPYAYSPTSSNTLKLTNRAEDIAAVSPRGHEMIIQVIAPGNDYWPLPWYLRRFPNIGYYTDFSGAAPQAAMVIAMLPEDSEPPTETQIAPLGERMQEFYGLREELMMSVYIRQNLWDAFMAKQVAE